MPPEQQLDPAETAAEPTATGPAPAGTSGQAAGKEAEKEEVKGYFETTGFERWNRIYSESDEVNRVQREQGDLAQRSFCDAGCGVGSLAIPLAQLGAGSIAASDLSEAMASEGRRRAEEAGISGERLQFSASDLESLEGRYDTVICLDVFIHYPQAAAEEMVRHLAGMPAWPRGT